MGTLPPHLMVYFARALFAEEDHEQAAARLTETLAAWGCWEDSWSTPMSEVSLEVAHPQVGLVVGAVVLVAVDGHQV